MAHEVGPEQQERPLRRPSLLTTRIEGPDPSTPPQLSLLSPRHAASPTRQVLVELVSNREQKGLLSSPNLGIATPTSRRSSLSSMLAVQAQSLGEEQDEVFHSSRHRDAMEMSLAEAWATSRHYEFQLASSEAAAIRMESHLRSELLHLSGKFERKMTSMEAQLRSARSEASDLQEVARSQAEEASREVAAAAEVSARQKAALDAEIASMREAVTAERSKGLYLVESVNELEALIERQQSDVDCARNEARQLESARYAQQEALQGKNDVIIQLEEGCSMLQESMVHAEVEEQRQAKERYYRFEESAGVALNNALEEQSALEDRFEKAMANAQEEKEEEHWQADKMQKHWRWSVGVAEAECEELKSALGAAKQESADLHDSYRAVEARAKSQVRNASVEVSMAVERIRSLEASCSSQATEVSELHKHLATERAEVEKLRSQNKVEAEASQSSRQRDLTEEIFTEVSQDVRCNPCSSLRRSLLRDLRQEVKDQLLSEMRAEMNASRSSPRQERHRSSPESIQPSDAAAAVINGGGDETLGHAQDSDANHRALAAPQSSSNVRPSSSSRNQVDKRRCSPDHGYGSQEDFNFPNPMVGSGSNVPSFQSYVTHQTWSTRPQQETPRRR